MFLKTCITFFEGREKVLNSFESKIFSTKSEGAGILNPDNSKLKVLTLTQILQRLPIALAQKEASNNSEGLLNEIRQIVYSLHQLKQIPKKVYNNKLFILCINQNKSLKKYTITNCLFFASIKTNH